MNPLANPLSIRQSIAITFQVIGAMILTAPLMILEDYIGKEPTFFIYYCISMGVGYWIVYTFTRSWKIQFVHKFELADFAVIVFIIVAIPCISIGVALPIASLIPMPDAIRDMFLEMASKDDVFAFLSIVIAAPILEELIFRGIVLEGLLRRYSALTSILVSSLLFGFVHLNPWQFITATILGCFMGWIYYRTRSVAMTIMIHLLNNLMAFLVSQSTEITIDSLEQTYIESYGGWIPFISYTLGALIILAGCLYYLNLRLDYFRPEQFPTEETLTHVETENKTE